MKVGSKSEPEPKKTKKMHEKGQKKVRLFDSNNAIRISVNEGVRKVNSGGEEKGEVAGRRSSLISSNTDKVGKQGKNGIRLTHSSSEVTDTL